MAKFNKEKDELLIESVKCYNAIYNKNDKEHKNNIYKHKCWEKISEVVGWPVSECKKRWKSLRDQYNKKIKECGTGSGRINSSWEYMDLMSFLSDAERRVSITNVQSEEITAYNSTQENTDDLSSGPSTSKKRRLSELQEIHDKRESQRLDILETLVNNTNQSIACQSQVKPQSAIKKFFESMAEVVETFPPHEQAAIRAKVCQLVSDTEIKLSSPMPMIPKVEDSWD